MENQGIKPKFLTPAEAVWESPWGLGLKPVPAHPEAAARVAICRGKFPFPVRKICGRSVVDMRDIENYAAPDPEARPTPCAPDAPRRRRGRPRKQPVSGGEA